MKNSDSSDIIAALKKTFGAEMQEQQVVHRLREGDFVVREGDYDEFIKIMAFWNMFDKFAKYIDDNKEDI